MADEQFVENGRGEQAEPHHPDLTAVHDSMVDGLSQLANYFGFSKVMGQLYGALLLSREPLSLDDLMERLSISKANVSMNMRTLEHMGMVRQVWLRGRSGRRKYYEAETNFLQIITNIISAREMRDVERAISVMEENAQRLSASRPTMTAEEKHQADLYLARIEQMEAMFKLAQLVIGGILAQVGALDLSDISDIEIK